MSSLDDDAALRASIAAIWDRGRDRAMERVDSIDAALEALRDGGLGDDLRTVAQGDAHQLAGALGSFGMPAGSDHARALELAFEAGPEAGETEPLAERAAELRRVIARGPER